MKGKSTNWWGFCLCCPTFSLKWYYIFSESDWEFFFGYLCYAVSMEAQLCCSILSKREIENIDT